MNYLIITSLAVIVLVAWLIYRYRTNGYREIIKIMGQADLEREKGIRSEVYVNRGATWDM